MAVDKQVVDAEQLIVQHLDLWTSAQTAKSTAGRGSNNKIELTGIKKLRELILELAVRGKLVPQDPSDEPASELLKRIALEREASIKSGLLRKQKTTVLSTEEEKPFELPSGWLWAKLPQVCTYKVGKTPSTKSAEYWANSNDYRQIPWVSISDLNHNSFVSTTERKITEKAVGEVFKSEPASAGDIVMSFKLTVGKISILDVDAFHNEAIISIKTGNYINKSFLFKILPARALDGNTKGAIKGNTLNSESLADINIPLPPLVEQERIVTKVDELMALCDQLEQQSYQSIDAHNQLVDTLLQTLVDSANANELASNWQRLSEHFDTQFTTEYSIDALKQTILQLAVMGKLVKQDPTDEPASELLKRIAKEKEALVKAGKIKKQKPLPAITDDEKPADLPFGWEWCRLENLISTMDSGWSPACMPDASPHETVWGVLKTTAVQTLEFREYENKELPESLCPRPELEVKAGDILITRAGPKNRVGISCLVEKTRPQLMISDKIIRFHLVGEIVSERFIALCLNAGPTADYLEKSKSGMAESQMNISQDKLKMAPIPLCSLTMQKQIMDKVDQLIAIAEDLKLKLKALNEIHQSLSESLIGKFAL